MNKLNAAQSGLFLVALLSASASAQTQAPPQTSKGQLLGIPRPIATDTSPGGLWTIVGPGQSFGMVMGNVAKHFAKLDADRDGVLTERDAPLLHDAGDQRQIEVLKAEFDRMDANHDGILTSEEIQAFYAQQYKKEVEEKLASAKRQPVDVVALLTAQLRIRAQEFLALDTSRDGQIDASELRTGLWMTIGPVWIETGDQLVSQLEAARNLTGRAAQDVSKEAYLEAAEAYFRRIDTDHNGEVSFEERGVEAEALAAAACELPKPSSNAQIVVLSGQAPLVSMVAVGGTQFETKAARIIVEDGPTPLYVIAIPPLDHASPIDPGTTVLWKIEGKIDRIERFVVAARPGIGVSGIPAGQVTLLRGRNCLAKPFDFDTEYSRVHDAMVKTINGEALAKMGAAAPAVYVAYQDDAAISLPSGRSAGKLSKLAWDDPSTWTPTVQVDRSTVVSTDPVVPYPTMPGVAGVQQLLKDGKVTHDAGARTEFVVTSDFQFPPGKVRGKFLVPTGVPIPRGDPGSACIFSVDVGGFVGRTVRKCTSLPPL